MTVTEIYEYYNNNWSEAARELKVGFTTIKGWRIRGYIPIRSQIILEKRTQGMLKARIEDEYLSAYKKAKKGE